MSGQRKNVRFRACFDPSLDVLEVTTHQLSFKAEHALHPAQRTSVSS